MNIPSPLSPRAFAFFTASMDCWLNIAEGGKRGGKDIVEVNAFCVNLERHPDKLHLVAGVSVAAAKLNIVDSNGYGLTNYFAGRCREGKYNDRDALYVKTISGEKIVLISGGGKKGDEKLIKGNTYGMALVTEANECHPDFLKEVFDRTISSKQRKIFHTLNPKNPRHWYYEEILNAHVEKQAANPNYGFNYVHLTIADNNSLSTETIRQVLGTYDKTSIWYKRDILGQRTVAEGGVFKQFAANPNRWIINKPAKYNKVYIGVDFGGNKGKTVFVAVGVAIIDGKEEVHIIDEHVVKANAHDIDSAQISREHKEFWERVQDTYRLPLYSFTDHNLKALTIQLGKDLKQSDRVKFVSKSISLVEWCKLLNSALNLDRIKILSKCLTVQAAFSGLLYDDKAADDIPLDDGSCDVDTYDATRYALSLVFLDWLQRRFLNGHSTN